MGEKSYVTYEDVVRFYKDKDKKEWPDHTKQFIKEGYGKTDDDYLDLEKVFSRMAEQAHGGGDSNPKSKDERYYHYLMEKKKSNYEKVAAFKDFESCTEISRLIEQPEKVTGNDRIEYPSQKWHFYVSYIAYQEFEGKVRDFAVEEFKYWSYARCPELMLWMAETALGSECTMVISTFDKAMKELKEFGDNKKKTDGDIDQAPGKAEERKDVERRVCKMIRRKIPWSCIEEKIKEKTRIDPK